MRESLSLVLVGTVAGGFASLAAVPPRLLGRLFYRFSGLLFLGLFLLAWAANPDAVVLGGTSARWIVLGCVLVAYVVVTWSPWTPLAYPLTVLSLPVGAALLWALAAAVRAQHVLATPSTPALAAHFLVSAALTGSSLTALLFGHWYLTTPGLSTRYLMRLHTVVLVGLGCAVAGAVVWAWIGRGTLLGLGVLRLESFAGVFLWSRVAFGFLAAGVAAGLTWHSLREGSTQAATGFLYLVVCFVWMGELVSRALLVQVGLPL